MMSSVEVDSLLRPLQLKELRYQCRSRGLNPGGGKEALAERIKESMLRSGDFMIRVEPAEGGSPTKGADPYGGYGSQQQYGQQQYGQQANPMSGNSNNNYTRPGGQQNVGNFLTDRNSSRVLAPPGGHSQIKFG